LRRHRRQLSQSLRPLLEKTDDMLDDIGHSRSDIEWALQLPLRVNAALALEERRLARTGPHQNMALSHQQSM